MNLIVDIGNTVAKIAVFDGQDMLEQVYDSNQTLSRLDEMYDRYKPGHAVVVSVIDLTDEVKKALDSLPVFTLYVDYRTPLPIKNLYETPRTLGYDRVAAVVGAFDQSLKGKTDGVFTPKYDTQEDIYNDLLKQLE